MWSALGHFPGTQSAPSWSRSVTTYLPIRVSLEAEGLLLHLTETTMALLPTTFSGLCLGTVTGGPPGPNQRSGVPSCWTRTRSCSSKIGTQAVAGWLVAYTDQ